MNQQTIAKSVELTGTGLHKGVPVTMRLEPLSAGRGIEIYRKDKNVYIPVNHKYVVDTKMATVIGKDGVRVSTIEHLLSAVYSYGIDNLLIVLDNDEVPIMDGSAASYCMLLDEAGIKEQNRPKRVLKVKKSVRVEDGEKFAQLNPSDGMVFDFTIDFSHPVIGREYLRFNFTKEAYLEEIARARTFGFLKEVQYLRSIGLARGGSLENAVVLDDNRVLNSEGLRYPDEFVRHKILDAIGDISLAGMPIMGEYRAFAGSHALNHALVSKLLSSQENYEIIEAKNQESRVLSYAFASS